jgi:hypothetical protein
MAPWRWCRKALGPAVLEPAGSVQLAAAGGSSATNPECGGLDAAGDSGYPHTCGDEQAAAGGLQGPAMDPGRNVAQLFDDSDASLHSGSDGEW